MTLLKNLSSKLKSKNTWQGGLFFAVFGPLIGLFTLWLISFFLDNHSRGTPSDSSLKFFQVVLFFVYFSYVFGIIPATITGFIVGLSRTKLSGPLAFTKAGLTGAAVTSLCFMLVMTITELKSGKWNFGSLLISATVPAIFGFICSLITTIFFVIFVKAVVASSESEPQ